MPCAEAQFGHPPGQTVVRDAPLPDVVDVAPRPAALLVLLVESAEETVVDAAVRRLALGDRSHVLVLAEVEQADGVLAVPLWLDDCDEACNRCVQRQHRV